MVKATVATRFGEDYRFALICVEASIAEAELKAAHLREDIGSGTASARNARVLVKWLEAIEALLASGAERRRSLMACLSISPA